MAGELTRWLVAVEQSMAAQWAERLPGGKVLADEAAPEGLLFVECLIPPTDERRAFERSVPDRRLFTELSIPSTDPHRLAFERSGGYSIGGTSTPLLVVLGKDGDGLGGDRFRGTSHLPAWEALQSALRPWPQAVDPAAAMAKALGRVAAASADAAAVIADESHTWRGAGSVGPEKVDAVKLGPELECYEGRRERRRRQRRERSRQRRIRQGRR